MSKKYLFGQEHFKKWAIKQYKNSKKEAHDWKGPQTYDCFSIAQPFDERFDHGFFVNAVCVWGRDLGFGDDGHEFALIARTYASKEEILNPPRGIKTYILPQDTMGPDDLGTPIATVITGVSEISNKVLNMAQYLPVSELACVLSNDLIMSGYGVMSKFDLSTQRTTLNIL